MDVVQTQNKTIEALRSQGLCVETDCGDIKVIPYDDGIANGVKIYLNDTLVCMVDCYRRPVYDLPRAIKEIVLDIEGGEDADEVVANYLSDTYGYCVRDFSFSIDKTVTPNKIFIWGIDWDTSGDDPEARLLIYGSDPDLDEPQQTITLN